MWEDVYFLEVGMLLFVYSVLNLLHKWDVLIDVKGIGFSFLYLLLLFLPKLLGTGDYWGNCLTWVIANLGSFG